MFSFPSLIDVEDLLLFRSLFSRDSRAQLICSVQFYRIIFC